MNTCILHKTSYHRSGSALPKSASGPASDGRPANKNDHSARGACGRELELAIFCAAVMVSGAHLHPGEPGQKADDRGIANSQQAKEPLEREGWSREAL